MRNLMQVIVPIKASEVQAYGASLDRCAQVMLLMQQKYSATHWMPAVCISYLMGWDEVVEDYRSL